MKRIIVLFLFVLNLITLTGCDPNSYYYSYEDLNSDNVSDDDFVEAMFVYIYSIREALSIYFNTVSKILYKSLSFSKTIPLTLPVNSTIIFSFPYSPLP